MSIRHQKAVRGFTLVELLVVIAIIALLISVLLPALRRARDSAQLVACLSNIRQVTMVAMAMYANDYHGQVCPIVGSKSGMTGLVAPYLLFAPNGSWGVRIDGYPPGSPWNASFADLMQPYFKGTVQRDQPSFREYAGVFYCAADWPGMDSASYGRGRPGWWANAAFREFSYRENYSVTPITAYDSVLSEGIPQFGRKVNVRNSSQKVLFAESHYEAVYGDRWGVLSAEGLNDSWGAGILTDKEKLRNSNWSPPRHRGGFVISFFDGSAQIVPFARRDSLCGQYAGSNYPNYPATSNWALAGWGPNWDLDVP